MNEKVSIIVPFYNAEKTLDKCLESIVNQTHKNIEIILIDDGSFDSSKNICEKYIEIDKRIAYSFDQNNGVSFARNKGIRLSTAPYISFVDADDWVEINYIELLLKNLLDNQADISVGQVYYLDNPKDSTNNQFKEEKIEMFNTNQALELLFLDDKLKSYPCVKIFKKELFKEIHFPESNEAFEDYATIFKIFSNAKKTVLSNQIIYNYVQYHNSLSHDLTPKRALDFFMSAIDMYNYSKKYNFNQRINNKILRKTLKQAFMCIKRILRNDTKNNHAEKIEKMRNEMKAFLKESLFNISIEYFLFLRLFVRFPKVYNQIVKK